MSQLTEHVHRYWLPAQPDAPGLYIGRCGCGATKEHRPYKDEEAHEGASWNTQAVMGRSVTRAPTVRRGYKQASNISLRGSK